MKVAPLEAKSSAADDRDEAKVGVPDDGDEARVLVVPDERDDGKGTAYQFNAIEDAGKYDDVMKPWETQKSRFALDAVVGDDFAFSCCTELEY